MTLPADFPRLPSTFHPEGTRVVASGQPGPEDFSRLAAGGVTVVVNLRPTAEMETLPFHEKSVAEAAGLVYRQIPIASGADLVPANAWALDAAIETAGEGEGHVLVHCVSANRVGALMALRAALKGTGPADALALGRAYGMTRLEPETAQAIAQALADGAPGGDATATAASSSSPASSPAAPTETDTTTGTPG